MIPTWTDYSWDLHNQTATFLDEDTGLATVLPRPLNLPVPDIYQYFRDAHRLILSE